MLEKLNIFKAFQKVLPPVQQVYRQTPQFLNSDSYLRYLKYLSSKNSLSVAQLVYMYAACPYVKSAIDWQMVAFGSIPLKVKDVNGNDVTDQFPVFIKPNSFQSISEYREYYLTQIKLAGSFYAEIVGDYGIISKSKEQFKVEALLPLVSTSMQVLVNEYGTIFEYALNSITRYAPYKIIYSKCTNPSDPRQGLPPLKSAERELLLYGYIHNFEDKFYTKGGSIGTVISPTNDMNKLDYERTEEYIRAAYSGVDGETLAFFDKSMEIKNLQIQTPVDSGTIESMSAIRDAIYHAVGTPLALGAGSETTFSNMEYSLGSLYQDNILPLCAKFIQDHKTLLPDGYTLEHDFSEIPILNKFDKEQNTLWLDAFVKKVMTLDEVREKLGLEAGVVIEQEPIKIETIEKAEIFKATKNMSDDEIELMAKSLLTTIDKKYYPEITKIIDYYKEIAKSYLNSSSYDAVNYINELNELIISPMSIDLKPIIAELAKDSFVSAKKLTETMFNKNLKLKLGNDLDKYVAERLKTLKGISATFTENVANIVSRGLSDGLHVNQIALEIQKNTNINEWKSLQIAQTEATNAFNAGQLEVLSQNGYTHKQWLSMGDARVRPEHQTMNGEIRLLSEAFSNGLQYPQEINCRCIIVGVKING